jgi:hypothetical protein
MGEIEKSQLGVLARKINEEHRAFTAALSTALERGIHCGELLALAKEHCPHGTWLPWLEENFEGATRTAQEYMRLHTHRDEIRSKYADSAHLSIGEALKEIAAPRSQTPFSEVLGYTRSELRRAIKDAREHIDAAQERRAEQDARVAEEEKRHPERKGKVLTRLDEHTRAIWEHGVAEERSRIATAEALLAGLDEVEKMWNLDAEGEASGWLREKLIALAFPLVLDRGERYRLALWDARDHLVSLPMADASRREIERRLQMSTATYDLTDTERMLLTTFAPDLLTEVGAAWEEDKDYELAIRKMETFTRPADVPPSRDHKGYTERLSEEQMYRTFADLRHTGELEAAFQGEDFPERQRQLSVIADACAGRQDEAE